MNAADDTIVSVSSPPGRSMRGLVRLSGPQTSAALKRLIQPFEDSEQAAEDLVSGKLLACQLLVSTSDECDTAHLSLPVLVTYRRGPRSYTGQDLAEIQCPGNPTLLNRCVQQVAKTGIRLAEPGEFSFRAFLAGKIDLIQAEGIAATIAAISDSQLVAASMLRRGDLGKKSKQLVDVLAQQLALVEAGIDFVDQDDVVVIDRLSLDKNLSGVEADLSRILSSSRSWQQLDALPYVVLIGAPSVGKSTLFNALLGRQRAVTDELAGTTRDVLSEQLVVESDTGQVIELILVDLAGLDLPQSELDHQIQRSVREAMQQADIILHLSDGTTPPVLEQSSDVKMIRVRTKSDREMGVAQGFDLSVSALTREGVPQLKKMLASLLGDRVASVSGQILALQPRHEHSLAVAVGHTREARAILRAQENHHGIDRPEVIASAIRLALDELAGLGGQMSPDDIIGRVFSSFCIGK